MSLAKSASANTSRDSPSGSLPHQPMNSQCLRCHMYFMSIVKCFVSLSCQRLMERAKEQTALS
eukprot:9209844-Alexandrium_andersonii.AAC.1